MNAKLTMGPILFHWDTNQKVDFYARVADESPVDTVYLGEVICSKRAPFLEKYYDEVAERLKKAGKKVVFSTLSEVMIKQDRKVMKSICARSTSEEIEVNDASALLYLSGKAHRIGPLMNIYNEESLKYLASKGAYHVSLPTELPRESIKKIGTQAKNLKLSLEVQVFGRISLALSARCYHARAHGKIKDNCQFVCEQDTDGMELKTLDGEPFLSINGIQTLSHDFLNLAYEMTDLKAMGVTHFRLSPHTNDMVETSKIFDRLLRNEIHAEEAIAKISETGINPPFSNGFYHQQPGYKWITPSDVLISLP